MPQVIYKVYIATTRQDAKSESSFEERKARTIELLPASF